MTGALKLVSALPKDILSPSVNFETRLVEGNILRIEFAVRNAKLNAKNTYPKNASVWGLWDSDVCEVFISSDQKGACNEKPYFEFQVSPFAQYFELKIYEPRKSHDENFRSGVRCGATVKTTQAWNSWLEIPLDALGLNGSEKIYGGVNACLLRAPYRAYMALSHPENQKPDFHLPGYFVEIL